MIGVIGALAAIALVAFPASGGRDGGARRASAAPAPARAVDQRVAPVPTPGPTVQRGSEASGFAHVAVSAAATPDGRGFWVVFADGGVLSYGDATWYGDMGTSPLNAPMTGIAATPDGHGYWLLGADGGVFSFGDAHFWGSTGNLRLNAPALQIEAPTGAPGYWFVARDGGVFSFGGAPFWGSTGGLRLAAPVVGMAANPSGSGYWLVAADGGTFSFGDVGFFGSMGGKPLAAPVVGMAATPDGHGYWLLGQDGGIFSYGDAGYHGSASGSASDAVSVVATGDGQGYWIVLADGTVRSFGSAPVFSAPTGGSTGAATAVDNHYSFEVTNAAGEPIRWNPCDEVTYAVVAAGAPLGWASDVSDAMSQLRSATGLNFQSNGAYASAASVPAGTKIRISWVPGLSGGDEVGLTTYYYIVDPRYTPELTAADIQLLSGLPAGGGRGELPVLLHELGHAVGLGHVNAPEVMNPVDQEFPLYQDGDLSGLAAVGSRGGCAGFWS
jgi:hypothetical protein